MDCFTIPHRCIYERYAVFRGHLPCRFGIVPVAVPVQVAVPVKPPAGHRREYHRAGPGRKGIFDEHPQVFSIEPVCRGIAFRVALLGIVVAELDEKVLPCLQVGLHLVPQTSVYEALGASPVLGIVHYRHAAVQVGRQPLAPASFRILFRKVLVRHGGIPHEPQDDMSAVFHSPCPGVLPSAQAEEQRCGYY